MHDEKVEQVVLLLEFLKFCALRLLKACHVCFHDLDCKRMSSIHNNNPLFLHKRYTEEALIKAYSFKGFCQQGCHLADNSKVNVSVRLSKLQSNNFCDQSSHKTWKLFLSSSLV